MIKKKLIELVRHRVTGVYESKEMGKLGEQMLEQYIGRAFNSLLIEVFRQNLSNFDPYTKTYLSVAISQEASTEIYYSTLPAPVIQLPRIGDGVMRISGMTSTSIEYVPITNGMLQVTDGLEVDTIDDVVGYVYKNGRIEYQGMTSTLAAGTVKMELVIPFEEYEMTDRVNIPTGSDDVLIRRVIELLMGIPDSDQLNNNHPINPNIKR